MRRDLLDIGIDRWYNYNGFDRYDKQPIIDVAGKSRKEHALFERILATTPALGCSKLIEFLHLHREKPNIEYVIRILQEYSH